MTKIIKELNLYFGDDVEFQPDEATAAIYVALVVTIIVGACAFASAGGWVFFAAMAAIMTVCGVARDIPEFLLIAVALTVMAVCMANGLCL